MLGAIRNWFFARVLNRHRLLFRFWNGSRFVSEDPFILFRRLLNTDKFDPDADMKLLEIKTDPKLVVRKMENIAEGVREIFGVQPLDRGGLTELECIQLLIQFSGWMDAVKKNGATTPILPAPFPVNDQRSGEPSLSSMSGNSGSGSIESGSSTLTPGLSPSESELS